MRFRDSNSDLKMVNKSTLHQRNHTLSMLKKEDIDKILQKEIQKDEKPIVSR